MGKSDLAAAGGAKVQKAIKNPAPINAATQHLIALELKPDQTGNVLA